VKIVCVGDLHAKPDNLDLVEASLRFAWSLEPDAVILLGDLLDTKEMIRGRCLLRYQQILSEAPCKHFIIPGNHDRFSAQPNEDHALELLQTESVTVVSSATVVRFKGSRLAFLPYNPPNQTRLDLSRLREQHPDPVHLLFAHADLSGFDYGNGHMCEDGISMAEVQGWLQNWCPWLVSGHFHKHQERAPVLYVGTPFSHDFGEANQTKFLSVFDTETGTFEHVKTPFRRHRTLVLDAADADTVRTTLLHRPDDLLRVTLTGPADAIRAVERLKGVRYEEDPVAEVSEAAAVQANDSPPVQFARWAKEIRNLDEETINLGSEILRDVLSN
jgi:DNA repair exonuclease SbcCD nuclease subunit